MNHFPITLFTSGVLGVLGIVLSVMVTAARAKTRVMIGDGTGTPGSDRLLIAIRAHGNFVEYVPLGLILLGGIEVSGASRLFCEVAAGLLTLSRVMHAAGMYRPTPNVLRAGGAILTWVVILVLSVEALILAA